jgi:hypothetical protein
MQSKAVAACSLKFITLFSIVAASAYAGDVYINKATKRSLMKLEGAGQRIGSAILEDRNMNGPYWTIDDLGRVEGAGLGPKWRERARDRIRITPEYRCWQCGAVIKLNYGEKEGICPYCKYAWPKKSFLRKGEKQKP